jgi:hypothetical protein
MIHHLGNNRMLRRLLDDMIRDVVFMWAHSFFRDVVDA